jgi:hypothetical protein
MSEESARQSLINKLKSVYQIGVGDGLSGGAKRKRVASKRKVATKKKVTIKRKAMPKKRKVVRKKKGCALIDQYGMALVGGYCECEDCMMVGEGRKVKKVKSKPAKKMGWLHRVKEYSLMHGIPYKQAMIALKGTQSDRY